MSIMPKGDGETLMGAVEAAANRELNNARIRNGESGITDWKQELGTWSAKALRLSKDRPRTR
jgi:hypothetical protein